MMKIYFVHCAQTWVELQMVKSQANTVVLRSMVRIPNTQVSPSRGRRMTVAFNVVLLTGRCLTGQISLQNLIDVWYLNKAPMYPCTKVTVITVLLFNFQTLSQIQVYTNINAHSCYRFSLG